eukprot:g2485.t1
MTSTSNMREEQVNSKSDSVSIHPEPYDGNDISPGRQVSNTSSSSSSSNLDVSIQREKERLRKKEEADIAEAIRLSLEISQVSNSKSQREFVDSVSVHAEPNRRSNAFNRGTKSYEDGNDISPGRQVSNTSSSSSSSNLDVSIQREKERLRKKEEADIAEAIRLSLEISQVSNMYVQQHQARQQNASNLDSKSQREFVDSVSVHAEPNRRS